MAEPPKPLPRNLFSVQKKPIPVPRQKPVAVHNNNQNEKPPIPPRTRMVESKTSNNNTPISQRSPVSSNETPWSSSNESEPRDNILLSCRSSNNNSDSNVVLNEESSSEGVNEVPELRRKLNKDITNRPRNSVILEFDPLSTKESSSESEDDCSHSTIYEMWPTDPPPPPKRFDSLPGINQEEVESKSNWFVESDTVSVNNTVETKGSTSLVRKLSNILRKPNNIRIDTCDRPLLPKKVKNVFNGPIRLRGGNRVATLSDGKLSFYMDASSKNPKDTISLLDIYSVQQIKVPNDKSSESCLELRLKSVGNTAKSFRMCGEKGFWVKQLSNHLTNGFPLNDVENSTRFGWCFIKAGVSTMWKGTWIMLVDRKLLYLNVYEPENGYLETESLLVELDLRKLRAISTRIINEKGNSEQIIDYPAPNTGRMLLLEFPDHTLFLLPPVRHEYKSWLKLLTDARKSGKTLEEQQLNSSDVPVIVHKCIDFIYAHGSLTEGIHRKAGSSSTIASLLEAMRKDAWSVKLDRTVHSEHDVAAVLRRFIRELPKPLLADEISLLHTKESLELMSRIEAYSAVMNLKSSKVKYATLKKLFGHLHFIHRAKERNLMSADSLAVVWTQTLIPICQESNKKDYGSDDVLIIRDLIEHFPSIWRVDKTELERYTRMHQVLLHVAQHNVCAESKPAGDFKCWMYILRFHPDAQVSITLTPNKTCGDICSELADRTGMQPHELMVEEVICNNALRRPLPATCNVLAAVSSWAYRCKKHAATAHLQLLQAKTLQLMTEIKKKMNSFLKDMLQYAGPKDKAFHMYSFEFRDGVLRKIGEKESVEEWEVNQMLWYFGHEEGRNPGTAWSITFTPKNPNKTCSEDPWFGHTLGGLGDENEQLKWLAAFAFVEYDKLLAEPKLINI